MKAAVLMALALALAACGDGKSSFTPEDRERCDKEARGVSLAEGPNGTVIIEQRPGPMWEECTKLGWTPPPAINLRGPRPGFPGEASETRKVD